MPIDQKVEISPEELFSGVLLEIQKKGTTFHPHMKKWHQAFFDAKSENPGPMEDFGVLAGDGICVYTLAECFDEFIEKGYLSRDSEGNYSIKNPKGMRDAFPISPKVQKIAKYICDRVSF